MKRDTFKANYNDLKLELMNQPEWAKDLRYWKLHEQRSSWGILLSAVVYKSNTQLILHKLTGNDCE